MFQIESELVDLVRDLRIGERPRSVKYMSRADLKVLRRAWVRGERDPAREPVEVGEFG